MFAGVEFLAGEMVNSRIHGWTEVMRKVVEL